MADIVQLDVPLFIRLLELAREDIKDDADIHDLVQRAIELSKNGPINMGSYNDLVGFMKQQGKEEGYNDNDIKRFRQIVDLASQDTISTRPTEQYADINSVTHNAGADGWQGTKEPEDIRGNSFRIYPSKDRP
jgi:hypothetical protein